METGQGKGSLAIGQTKIWPIRLCMPNGSQEINEMPLILCFASKFELEFLASGMIPDIHVQYSPLYIYIYDLNCYFSFGVFYIMLSRSFYL
jgi:hypothetical protein